MMSAIDAGPVAAPGIPPSTLATISDGASHATAVSNVAITNPPTPIR